MTKGIECDMSDAMAISTTQLTKSFGNIDAVSNVNLKISSGKIYALLGKNGAGKTTLFKLLLGLQQPTCGSCCVLGKDTKNSILSILKEVGTLIEIPVFFENLSAMENLKIHLEYMGTSGNIQETLEMVGLHILSIQLLINCTVNLICNSVIAGLFGVISLWIGFYKKSVSTTIVASCIIVSLCSQILTGTFTTNIVSIVFLAISIFLAVLAVRSLHSQVDRMEV